LNKRKTHALARKARPESSKNGTDEKQMNTWGRGYKRGRSKSYEKVKKGCNVMIKNRSPSRLRALTNDSNPSEKKRREFIITRIRGRGGAFSGPSDGEVQERSIVEDLKRAGNKKETPAPETS